MSGPPPALAAVRVAVRSCLADLAPGAVVLVACSGGPDSLALAAAAAFEAEPAALRVGAVVVDHGLQAGSAERSHAVAGVLTGLGLEPVHVQRVSVGRAGGPEAAARLARYDALDAAAERFGAATVLLGHTRDDQAETVLLGLARGSGARSLSGMAPVSGRYRRPLLQLDRATTVAASAAAGLRPWSDPHNVDPAYARARVRACALPVLERELGSGVAAALARTADLLRADADALDSWAESAAEAAAGPDGGLDTSALSGLPHAVRSRVLRGAALAAGSPAGSLAAVHIAALDGLVTRWHGQGPVDLPGGVTAERACDRLCFALRPDRVGAEPAPPTADVR
jgi:tRNA(Ile)-lysidine synthase